MQIHFVYIYLKKYRQMNSFTISQLQRYSGINVHRIRAWEKRYNALKPDRSEGNTRYYNGNQLRRLLNIASLINSEHKVSEICSLSDSKLCELMAKNLEQHYTTNNDELLISQLVSAAMDFNESLFDKVFSQAIKNYQLEGTYLKVIYPFLQRLGLMWLVDRIPTAQEHFISNLIRQKLYSSIDLLPLNSQSKKHCLLFLPQNEFHESGLLMANYLVRNAGQRCTYLGSNVSFESLKNAVLQLKPCSLLFFLVSNNEEKNDKELINLMLKHFPMQKIIVATQDNRLLKIKANKNLFLISSVNELKALL